MFRQHVASFVVALTSVSALLLASGLGVAGRQEKTKNQPKAAEKAKPDQKSSVEAPTLNADKAEALIEKFLAAYDLTPRPLPPIPDDPPPHEGAMIRLPHIVEPPDLVIVEVLEALPGRPISGERMVRPDGTISLGFYGDVPVQGLTLDQVKVAIIKHLREYLDDATLGLIEPVEEEVEAEGPAIQMPVAPERPKGEDSPLEVKPRAKPRSSTYPAPSSLRPVKPRTASYRPERRSVSLRSVLRTARRRGAQDKAAPPPTGNQLTVPLSGPGRVTITIQVDGQGLTVAQPAAEEPAVAVGRNERWQLVPPEKSTAVFVDVTAYNTKHHYVLGDVATPGKIPCTGNETILDALQHAGGFLPTAEPKDIRLIRPARGGKPTRVYKVDLTAIEEKGDITSNYQIFPGDRLIVGRNDVVKKTIEFDRLAAPVQAIANTMLQQASLLRGLQLATASNRDELLREYVDFWAKELARPGGVKFDEQTLREAFIRNMKLLPGPVSSPPR
jgi:protein involved in polysaccharide export with SLBB domain